MRKTKNKVCDTTIKRILEVQYYTASYHDSCNLLYYMNARKKESENETQVSQSSK